MEGISAQVYKGIKKYWNRRGYVRLNNTERRNRARATLGQEQPDPAKARGKRRRFWRVKISPRVRIWSRVGSPRKWLTRIRDAYVNMMLKISSTGISGGASGYGGSMGYGFGYGNKGELKEYDEKVIVEIYKSLVIAQGQLVVPRVGNSNSNSNSNGNNGDAAKVVTAAPSQHRISISTRWLIFSLFLVLVPLICGFRQQQHHHYRPLNQYLLGCTCASFYKNQIEVVRGAEIIKLYRVKLLIL